VGPRAGVDGFGRRRKSLPQRGSNHGPSNSYCNLRVVTRFSKETLTTFFEEEDKVEANMVINKTTVKFLSVDDFFDVP
jgi:hypothetical protein